MSLPEAVALVGAGTLIAVYAQAIGVGGGFLIAPLLLWRNGEAPPDEITAASLSVVALVSGLAVATGLRDGRVDRGAVGALALVAVPGALLGATGASLLGRQEFALGFTALLLLLAVHFMWHPAIALFDPGAGGWRRRVRDRDGNVFLYRIPLRRSAPFALGAAALAALSGAGAGILMVPLATRVMRMPHWLALPTAQGVVFIVAVTAVLFHLALGRLDFDGAGPMGDVPWLGLGVIVAAPLGRRLNRRLGESRLTRLLAIGIVAVAVRTLIAEV